MFLDQYIRDLFARVEPVGSRVVCDPPPVDTDADFLCLAKLGTSRDVEGILSSLSYEIGGSRDPLEDPLAALLSMSPEFTSYRRGEINLIVTESPVFFQRFLAATHVAKRLNLLNKDDRIALHRAVLYGWGGE